MRLLRNTVFGRDMFLGLAGPVFIWTEPVFRSDPSPHFPEGTVKAMSMPSASKQKVWEMR